MFTVERNETPERMFYLRGLHRNYAQVHEMKQQYGLIEIVVV